MPKVKILLCEVKTYGEYDDHSVTLVRDSITDWEEISDEDLKFLKTNMHHLVQVTYPYHASLIVQDGVPVATRITNIKAKIETQKKRVEAEKKKQAAAQTEREAKKLLKKKAKTEEQERALLEELKKKYKK